MIKYPGNFPLPTIDGYAIDVDMGVLRTSFETGYMRQRRRYRSMPHVFNWSFVIPAGDLDDWQTWIDEFAYDYFEIKAYSYLSGGIAGKPVCSEHVVRFISNLNIAPVTATHVRVTVQAELAPQSLHQPPARITGDWIVAQDPATPSADWTVAQTPSTAPIDWVVAGTPLFPAALI